MKDAYIAIKTSDQIVEIGTSRLQKYSRFRVSSERQQFAPCVETGAGKQLPCVDRRASACRVPNIRCGKSQLTCPSLPFAGKKRVLNLSNLWTMVAKKVKFTSSLTWLWPVKSEKWPRLCYVFQRQKDSVKVHLILSLNNHDVKNHLLQIDKREYLILSWYRCIINDWWVK